jgi:hypothetical protein
MVAPPATCRLDPRHIRVPPAAARCIAIGRLHPGCPPSAPPAPAERHVLASQHAKFPQLNSLKSVIQNTYRSTSRTSRLTTLTAAATLAAVAAGLSASSAAASTGGQPASGQAGTVLSLSGSTGASLAGGQAGVLNFDAAAMNTPLGQFAAPAARAPQPVTPPVTAQSPLAVAAPAPTHAAVSVRPVTVPAGHAASAAPAAPAGAASAAPGASTAPAARSAAGSPAPASRLGRHPARHVVKPVRPFLIFDSLTPSAIPRHHMIATYATGGYAVPASQVAGREVLWIDTRGTDPAAAALDVEPGDATPSVAASWAWHKLRATPDDVARIYTMISEWPAVKAAIGGLPQRMRSHVRYWIADPTGVPHIVPGASATQWYWGKHYDISTAKPGFR